MPDRPSTGQANQRAPHAGDRRSYPVLIDLHLQPVLNNANQACPGLRGALPVTGPQSCGHQSAAGGWVRHIAPSVSRRPEDSLGDISLLPEGGLDTQCHRFHGDSRTVLGIYVYCWREGQTHSAFGLTATRGQSWGHQSADGGRVRHTVPSVSRRPEESLVHISMPLEGGSDTQCHRFHGDSRTVLGISVCCWREGQTQTPSTGLRHPSFRKLPVSDARSVGQTHSAIGFTETREQSCGHVCTERIRQEADSRRPWNSPVDISLYDG